MKSLFDTLNIVYGEDEKRGFVKLNAISLLFTVGGILFVVAALGAIVVIPLALAVIYRYGPSCEAPRWRWIT